MSFLIHPYKKIFLNKVLEDGRRIIVLNKDYKRFIIKEYGISSNKIFIIPNATEFKIVKKERINLNNPINLLFVGRLSVEKNIPKLIETVSLLKDKNIILNIVGEGEQKNEIQGLIKEKNLKNVLLHGRKEGNP